MISEPVALMARAHRLAAEIYPREVPDASPRRTRAERLATCSAIRAFIRRHEGCSSDEIRAALNLQEREFIAPGPATLLRC